MLVVEKTTEIPQFQVADKVVDVPVVSVMQVPRVCAVKKIAETPQFAGGRCPCGICRASSTGAGASRDEDS